MKTIQQQLAFELSRTLDHDYAEVLAERYAVRVKVGENGQPDAESLASVVKDVSALAPQKFRRGSIPGDDLRDTLNFYETIRAQEKARQAAHVKDPTAEAARRFGSTPVQIAKARLPKDGQ